MITYMMTTLFVGEMLIYHKDTDFGFIFLMLKR